MCIRDRDFLQQVDVHISRIRRSLQIRPERGYRIKTVYQHGYRLEPIDD